MKYKLNQLVKCMYYPRDIFKVINRVSLSNGNQYKIHNINPPTDVSKNYGWWGESQLSPINTILKII